MEHRAAVAETLFNGFRNLMAQRDFGHKVDNRFSGSKRTRGGLQKDLGFTGTGNAVHIEELAAGAARNRFYGETLFFRKGKRRSGKIGSGEFDPVGIQLPRFTFTGGQHCGKRNPLGADIKAGHPAGKRCLLIGEKRFRIDDAVDRLYVGFRKRTALRQRFIFRNDKADELARAESNRRPSAG